MKSATIALLLLATPARALTIDLNPPGNPVLGMQVDGYVFTDNGAFFDIVNTLSFPQYAADQNNGSLGTTTIAPIYIHRVDDTPFSITSIDFASFLTNDPTDFSASFYHPITGAREDFAWTTPNATSWTTVTFNETNISQIFITSSNRDIAQFDNIVIPDETPIPGAAVLFPTGLGLLGWLGLRRRRAHRGNRTAQGIAA